MNQILQWAKKMLPDNLVGALEYHLRPSLGEVWGGAFNGQCIRQCIVASLLRVCEPELIVETGTFRGTSTLFLAINGRVPVQSVEANARAFGFARRRLREQPNVFLRQGDSREFLKGLSLRSEHMVFFYLDAHWAEDLPLKAETDLILAACRDFVIMIDDFRVPGDSGYGYDNYGLGKSLELRDFPFHEDPRVRVYFPAVPSGEESGSKRGCIVLASGSAASRFSSISLLRPYLTSDC